MSYVFPNRFPEDVWRKIVDMDLVVKEKKKTKSSVQKVAKSSKKRKAETETESDGKIEVKVKVTIDEEQPTLVADYNERDIEVRLVGEAAQAPLTAVVDRDFFSQESEPTTKRRSSHRRSS